MPEIGLICSFGGNFQILLLFADAYPLRLNGNWLEEAGFSTDTSVMVSVGQGRLVIEPVRG